MRIHRLLAAVLFSLVACGPMGTAELVVEVSNAALLAGGGAARVTVTATDEDGKVGTGTVRVTSSAGSLVDGVDVELDSFGTAVVELQCNPTADAACNSAFTVEASWSRGSMAAVTGTKRVSGPTGGSGAGSGAGNGGAGSGGSGGSGGNGGGSPGACMFVNTECTMTPNFMRLEMVDGNFNPFPGWGPSLGDLRSTFVKSSVLVEARGTCADDVCTRVGVTFEDLGYDDTPPIAPENIAYRVGGSTERTAIDLGGSADEPTLREGRYLNGKVNPPVTDQPYFSPSYCPLTVTEFNVCTLRASGNTLNELLVGFRTTCVGANVYVQGCAHFTR